MAWQHGTVEMGYRRSPSNEPIFKRYAGALIESIGTTAAEVDRADAGPWQPDYAAGMRLAIDRARQIARGVIVAVGPVVDLRTGANFERLQRVIPLDGNVKVVDLSHVAALRHPDMTLDGYSLSAAGRSTVARVIGVELMSLLSAHRAELRTQ